MHEPNAGGPFPSGDDGLPVEIRFARERKHDERFVEDRRVWSTWYSPGVPDEDFASTALSTRHTARQIEEGPGVGVYMRVGWDVVGEFRRARGPEESRQVLEEMDAIVQERMAVANSGESIDDWEFSVVLFGNEESLPLPETLRDDGWRVMVDVQRVELLSLEDVEALLS